MARAKIAAVALRGTVTKCIPFQQRDLAPEAREVVRRATADDAPSHDRRLANLSHRLLLCFKSVPKRVPFVDDHGQLTGHIRLTLNRGQDAFVGMTIVTAKQAAGD